MLTVAALLCCLADRKTITLKTSFVAVFEKSTDSITLQKGITPKMTVGLSF